MIIYADELIIKNFFISFFILLIVGEILSLKYKKRNLIFGSLISSFITLLSYIYEIESSFFIRIITISLMTYISFKNKKVKDFLIEATFILGITFLIGGIVNSNIKNNFEIIICIVISIIALKQYTEFYKKRKWKARNKYKLSFEIEKKTFEIIAVLDTGNFITTNFNEPVIIISKNALEGKASNNIINLLLYGNSQDVNKFKNLRLINYQVINEENKIAYGLKVENIKIKNSECEIIRDAVIMLSKNKIKESDGIIGINLLEGGISSGDDFNFKAESKEVIC